MQKRTGGLKEGYGVVLATALAALGCSSARAPEQVGESRGLLTIPSSGQLSETFDAIGTSSAATLPSGWRVDKQSAPRTVGSYASAGTTTIARSGASLASNATNSIYNFGSGVASSQSSSYWLSSSDRAIGWLGTGASVGSGGTKSGNLYVQLQAPAEQDLSGLDISYNVEKYRAGTTAPGYVVQLFWSTDGTNWTSAGSNFRTAFAADANGSGFDPAPGATSSVPTTRLNQPFARGSSIYLAWNYTVDSTSAVDFTSAQALAVDDVTIGGVPGSSPFVVWSTAPGFQMPDIVLPNTVGTTDFSWSTLSTLTQSPSALQDRQAAVRDGVQFYLQRALTEMTGHTPAITNQADPTTVPGIVFVTRDAAPTQLQNDPAVVAALTPTGPYGYENYEAYFIRTSATQLLVVANRPEGWVTAIPDILESVGYETLSYGPSWTTKPDFSATTLSFNLLQSGRPGFFFRGLVPAGSTGTGTVWKGDPAAPSSLLSGDEFLQTTLARFRVGTRSRTSSVQRFTGDGGSNFYAGVVSHMRSDGCMDNGFLNHTTSCATTRPSETDPSVQAYDVWIDPNSSAVFVLLPSGTGLAWAEPHADLPIQVTLDVSVSWVREIMLASMETLPEDEPGTHRGFRYFASSLYEFNAQPTDGGTWGRVPARFPNWYTDYRTAESVPLSSESYVLNGYQDALGRSSTKLNHSTSSFDPESPTDHLFALANWLLREYDKFIDCQAPRNTNCLAVGNDNYGVTPPVIGRKTADGIEKKTLIRAGLQSYNSGDVLPSFNLDPRVMVAVAGYAKHRGYGDWSIFSSHDAIARAFQVLLPNQPLENYELVSEASSGGDKTMAGAVNSIRSNPLYWAKKVRDDYASGSFRAFNGENDLNGGKLGLAYYLMLKVMNNPQLTDGELASLVTHWLNAAYGANALSTMTSYYDVALAGQALATPNLWAQSMQLLDQAASGSNDAASQQRLDELKQHWLHYYLVDVGHQSDLADARALGWKGQMAYQVSARVDLLMTCGTTDLYGCTQYTYGSTNPFHFSATETNTWWTAIKDHWQYTPVTNFADVTLADNVTKGSAVDLDDLVVVSSFGPETGTGSDSNAYMYNGYTQTQPTFRTVATSTDVSNGNSIGFQLYWANGTGSQVPAKVSWGVRRYDRFSQTWDEVFDIDLNATDSQQKHAADSTVLNVVIASFKPTLPGVYEFTLGKSGNSAKLVDLDWDVEQGTAGATRHPLTFVGADPGTDHLPCYFYIPKGVATLSLEEWDPSTHPLTKEIWLFRNLTGSTAAPSGSGQLKTFAASGTQNVALLTGSGGDAGALAASKFFPVPYFYSIPTIWAKSPRQLLVPRKIAELDNLTIVGP